MTFDFDALVGGPEHDRSWASDAFLRISRLIAERPTGPGVVVLRWHIGGSISGPGWKGPGKPLRKGSVVAVHIGVPTSDQDDDLEPRLLEYIDAAVERAGGALSTAQLPFDEAGHRAAVDWVRSKIEELGPARPRRAEFTAAEERFARRNWVRESTPEVYSEPRAGSPMPEFAFSWSTQGALDRLFELEDTVDKALRAAGLGEVDGNEIGANSYVLFVAPKRGKKEQAVRLVSEYVEQHERRQ